LPVSMTPAIDTKSLKIFIKIRNAGAMGETHSWIKPKVENLVSDSL
jgi:hypothetical protein